MQILAKRFCAGLPDGQSFLDRQAFDLPLNLVQRSNALYRLCAYRTQVVLDQFIKLAARVRQTSCADTGLL